MPRHPAHPVDIQKRIRALSVNQLGELGVKMRLVDGIETSRIAEKESGPIEFLESIFDLLVRPFKKYDEPETIRELEDTIEFVVENLASQLRGVGSTYVAVPRGALEWLMGLKGLDLP